MKVHSCMCRLCTGKDLRCGRPWRRSSLMSGPGFSIGSVSLQVHFVPSGNTKITPHPPPSPCFTSRRGLSSYQILLPKHESIPSIPSYTCLNEGDHSSRKASLTFSPSSCFYCWQQLLVGLGTNLSWIGSIRPSLVPELLYTFSSEIYLAMILH